MDILIVEDDENKRNQLRGFFSEFYSYAHVRVARSVQSAVRSVMDFLPDILILDMSLPNFDVDSDEFGGKARKFGGREILRQLDRKRITLPVIVVTGFDQFERERETIGLDDLDRELHFAHGGNYRGAVYYHAALYEWQVRLCDLINEIAIPDDSVQ